MEQPILTTRGHLNENQMSRFGARQEKTVEQLLTTLMSHSTAFTKKRTKNHFKHKFHFSPTHTQITYLFTAIFVQTVKIIGVQFHKLRTMRRLKWR